MDVSGKIALHGGVGSGSTEKWYDVSSRLTIGDKEMPLTTSKSQT